MTSYTTYTDEALLALLADNDSQAFRVLYERYWNRLLVQAYCKLNNRQEAEEIVQELFLNLWRRRHSIAIQFSFHAYIASIVKYEVLRRLAKQKLKKEFEQQAVQLYPDNCDNTRQWLEYEQVRRDIEATIATLPEKCRLVFRLSREAGLSGKEIAQQLQISPKTVEAHMGKALKTLRRALLHVFSFLA